jgi:4-cresol dehydrogenase (hydroxylating) flavoprotein subunit
MNDAFFDELTRIVGHQSVFTDGATVERFARSTAPNGTTPIGVVRPGNREQVRDIVRLAASLSVPVFPVSRGKNWGYGDACAPRHGNLIIDMSGMNRILEVNSELAYAVIEPGVTQGQLVEYIEKNGLQLMLDVTGAGEDASIVGNVLERGSGHTPYGDHFATSCNFEIVLSDGSVITTGFGDYHNSQAQHVYKWGVGPSLDGIFTQSNLGIITRMTVWLMPKPENFLMFLVILKTAASIGPFFEAIRRLRLAGTLRSTLHCFNDRRLLSGVTRFPWDQASGRQALEVECKDLFRELCENYGIPAWGATGSVQGTKREVAAGKRSIRRALSSVPGLRLVFLSPKSLKWARRVAGWLSPTPWGALLSRRLDSAKVGMDMLLGRPSNKTLRGSHWRARTSLDDAADPLDTGSGLAWISPILPMTALAINEVCSLSEQIFHRHGFEYQVTMSAITERALIAVQSISFDHSNQEETLRARDCESELVTELLKRGYVPYRGPISIMEKVWQSAPHYWEIVSALKRAYDSKGIIAPGRYIRDGDSV